MKFTLLLMIVALLCAVFIVPLLIAAARKHSAWFNTRLHRRHLRRVALANDNLALECRKENIRLTADAAVARYLLVKSGSDVDHAAICGASDVPIGNSDDSPAADDPFTVNIFGLGERERIVIASAAIATVMTDIYTAANGKVSVLSATPGTYYLIGRNTQTAAGDGDKMRIIPCFPVKVVVT